MSRKGLLIARGRGENAAVNGSAPTLVPFGPLACLPVANRPLIEHAVESLRSMGVTDAVIAVEADAVARTRPVLDRIGFDSLGMSASICQLPEGADLRRVIAAAASRLGEEPFVLHLGEALWWASDDACAETDLADDEVIALIGSSNGEEPHDPSASVRGRSKFGHLGIYAVASGFVETLAAVETRGGLAAQARAAVNRLVDRGGRTHHWRKPDSWHYAPGAGSLLQANRLVLERLEQARIPEQVRDSDVDGAVAIDPTAVVEASTLRGPMVIGPNAVVTDSYIGPFTSVDHDVVIDGAELENSIVLEGASVRHIGSRLEGSIIGPEAKVFRDFRIPRAVRLDVGAGAQVSLA